MATLLFSAIGTALAGPLGGAIGALAGRAVDTALIGGGRREGPRLKELAPTTSSYGEVLPRHFGRMRVAGSIIWATDLVEHRQSEGGGKGRPSVTTYTYTASFAVALASRPIARIGRIWADGNLLRGAEGDLKVAGTLRLHTGWGDQSLDPLIAAAEGADRCPAWRGLAYAVFEDLDLGEFFNRIPALTFEVVADEGAISLRQIVGELIEDSDAAVDLPGFAGLSCEGPLADTLALLDPLLPIDCDGGGERLTLARERLQAAPLALADAAVSSTEGDFGGRRGFARRRVAQPPAPPEVLRYYDVDRDYQRGLQRAGVRTGPGQPRTTELPAALTAVNARALAEAAAQRAVWRGETLSWRSAELDPAIAPGALVTVPGINGRWRVAEWEWRAEGVELTLVRAVPPGADAPPELGVDSGRIIPPIDLPAPATVLSAFELPWDGVDGSAKPALFAAVSSSGAHWRGAALFVDRGDGELHAVGASGRRRSTIGMAQGALGPASPLLIDRSEAVVVELVDPAMVLEDAGEPALAAGANRALLGNEILQFARAEPLGSGRWRLHTLLRGRGGTEAAVSGHQSGEGFVLLDDALVALDLARVADHPGSTIAALGLGDDTPATTPILLAGIGRRPLTPVHPRLQTTGGGLTLTWTRRARGAWAWSDGIDAPLHEEAERYLVTLGAIQAPDALWEVHEPRLSISHEAAASLPPGALHVRQRGTYALSEPLLLAHLA